MSVPNYYDSHMHTPLCKHAKGTPTEYARVAEQRGLKGIIFTCHNPAPFGWCPKVRMSINEYDEYLDMITQAREEWAGRVDVRTGLESDYMPGMESWLETLHDRTSLDYVLGSVHPQMDEYKSIYLNNNDIVAYQRSYFENLALAAESGLFDTLSHPDLVKTVHPNDWKLERVWDDILRALDRIAVTGIAMELNTSGLNKAYREMNPGREMLAAMFERDIPVVLGSDSHEAGRVGADFEDALDILSGVGYTHVNYFLERQMNLIAIDEIHLASSVKIV